MTVKYSRRRKNSLSKYNELTQVNEILLTHCRKGNLDLVSLASLSNDLVRIQSISAYLLSYIKKKTQTNFSFDINITRVFSQTKTELDARIHSDYPVSLCFHLSNWVSVKWQEKKPSNEVRNFVQELGYFLKKTLTQITDINYTAGVSLAYLSFKEINKTLMDVFLHKVKNFNIVDLSILDLELDYLCKIADEDFFHLDRLKDTLDPMKQFINMFLQYHPNDYADPKKRNEKFYSLGPVFLLKVLPKYKKKIVDGLPQVRRRECEALCKYIQETLVPHDER